MDNLIKKQRQYYMPKIRSKNTKPKKDVGKILDKLNIKYNIHIILLFPNLKVRILKNVMLMQNLNIIDNPEN